MVSVYNLDLEYLQAINCSQDTLNLVSKTLDAQLAQLNSLPESTRRATLVLGTVLWENSRLEQSILESIKHKVNSLGAAFHLVAGINYKHQLASADCNITFIDFFALRTYLACLKQPINTEWNFKNNKILFLMGKAYKPHRIGLLYLLYKHGLLTDHLCAWSCTQLDFDEARKFLPRDLAPEQVTEFIKHCPRAPDSANIVLHDNINTHYGGFPFDKNLYSTTSLSLISETASSGSVFVTEKTYRAIVNHHPFVIASTVGQNKQLQQQGFFTFDEFMKFPMYNHRANTLAEIAENVKCFNPTPSEIDIIGSMIEHNAQRFNTLVQEESSKLQSVLDSHGIAQSWQDVISWEDSPNYFLSWQFYYQTIKGETWPPCDTVEDCNKLPPEIQNELRSVFKVIF